DGRAHRRDQQGQAHHGGRKEHAHEEARQAPAHAASAGAARGDSAGARRLAHRAQRRRQRARVHLRRQRGSRRHRLAAAAPRRAGHRLQGPEYQRELARGHLRQPGERARMNWHGVLAIYKFEMARARRTLWQSLVTPVITTSLYFIVFGAAIGSRMSEIDSVPYGAFIVPGLIMLSLFPESLSNASFVIYLPRFPGTTFVVLSPPASARELVPASVAAVAAHWVVLLL